MDNKTDAQLTRLLAKKIGPVDLNKVIGSKAMLVGGKTKYVILLNGHRIEDGEAQSLKHEAEVIENTQLYRVLTETLRYQTQQRMFQESKNAEEIYITGKLMLHCIAVWENIVASCKEPLLLQDQKKLSTPKNPVRVARTKLTGENNGK